MDDKAPQQKPPPTISPTDFEVLKAKLSWLESGDRRVMQAFGICATVLMGTAILLVGMNWYNSKFNYERDKAAMSRELDLENNRQFILLQSNLARLITEATSQISVNFSNRSEEMMSKVQSESDNRLNAMEGVASNANVTWLSQKTMMETVLSNQTARFAAREADSVAKMGAMQTNMLTLMSGLNVAYASAESDMFLEQAMRLLQSRQYYDAAISAIGAGRGFLKVPDFERINDCIEVIDIAFKNLKHKELERQELKEAMYGFQRASDLIALQGTNFSTGVVGAADPTQSRSNLNRLMRTIGFPTPKSYFDYVPNSTLKTNK